MARIENDSTMFLPSQLSESSDPQVMFQPQVIDVYRRDILKDINSPVSTRSLIGTSLFTSNYSTSHAITDSNSIKISINSPIVMSDQPKSLTPSVSWQSRANILSSQRNRKKHDIFISALKDEHSQSSYEESEQIYSIGKKKHYAYNRALNFSSPKNKENVIKYVPEPIIIEESVFAEKTDIPATSLTLSAQSSSQKPLLFAHDLECIDNEEPMPMDLDEKFDTSLTTGFKHPKGNQDHTISTITGVSGTAFLSLDDSLSQQIIISDDIFSNSLGNDDKINPPQQAVEPAQSINYPLIAIPKLNSVSLHPSQNYQQPRSIGDNSKIKPSQGIISSYTSFLLDKVSQLITPSTKNRESPSGNTSLSSLALDSDSDKEKLKEEIKKPVKKLPADQGTNGPGPKRKRIKPIAHWKNECLLYDDNKNLIGVRRFNEALSQPPSIKKPKKQNPFTINSESYIQGFYPKTQWKIEKNTDWHQAVVLETFDLTVITVSLKPQKCYENSFQFLTLLQVLKCQRTSLFIRCGNDETYMSQWDTQIVPQGAKLEVVNQSKISAQIILVINKIPHRT
ncbi:hypothetical protein SteCoe_31714 [Stentor coeruleus]|uniref:Uncharacterized protein n=1 Tax=Stentor coeruleus TaxID=5963 RepID=A0A1R2B0S5_9CILI|nr:hypothetical protein SteCoe_31714 [Stentor coeruleus]